MTEDKKLESNEKDQEKFENPTPSPGESQKDYIGRCIPIVKKEHPDWEQDQVVAVCYSMWRRKHEGKDDEKTFESFMNSLGYEKFTESGKLIFTEKETKSEIKFNNAKSDSIQIVAMIGDRFMNGGFFSMKLLTESYKMWERTLHDINHEGTGSLIVKTGLDITKFIGYHKNVVLDEANKCVLMELIPEETTVNYNAWKGFVNLNRKAGRTPNVSVTYWGKRQWLKTSDLPNEADWKGEGFSESDRVPVLTSVLPICVSTVLIGKCNDRNGCGIQNTNSKECGSKSCDCDLEKINAEREEQIKRIKDKEKKLTED